MKFSCNRALALVVISSTFLLAATSCKKSNSGGGSAGVSASINGAAWTSNFPTTGIYSTLSSEFEIAGIQFKGGDSTAVALAFLGPVVLNHAMSSDTAAVDLGYVDIHNQIEYDGGISAGHSILTITSYDSTGHKIAGKFTGVLYNISGGSDSLVITNGSFNTSFTAQ
jgi:hypothetical protein